MDLFSSHEYLTTSSSRWKCGKLVCLELSWFRSRLPHSTVVAGIGWPTPYTKKPDNLRGGLYVNTNLTGEKKNTSEKRLCCLKTNERASRGFCSARLKGRNAIGRKSMRNPISTHRFLFECQRLDIVRGQTNGRKCGVLYGWFLP